MFIELDDRAEEIWQEYISLQTVADFFEKKRRFDKIKNEFYQYVISIPANAKNKPPMMGEIGYVARNQIGDYYSEETGFIPWDTKAVIIW